jgi:hypothetical protein
MGTLSSSDIANLSLARIGAERLNDLTTDSSVQSIHCRLIYEPDRQALLRRYWWPFAARRAKLAQSATVPACEYAYQYALPNDFLTLRSIWDSNGQGLGDNFQDTCSIEGQFILSDNSELYIRYTADVTDTTKFDPLFIQCLKTRMALDLLYPLGKTSANGAADRLQMELDGLLIQVKQMSLSEQNLRGRNQRGTWLDARLTDWGRDPAHLGS